MVASFRAEEHWKGCSFFPTDHKKLRRTGDRRGQQTPARASAVIPTTEGDFGELIARPVAAAMTPLDAKLKMLQTDIIAMKSLEG